MMRSITLLLALSLLSPNGKPAVNDRESAKSRCLAGNATTAKITSGIFKPEVQCLARIQRSLPSAKDAGNSTGLHEESAESLEKSHSNLLPSEEKADESAGSTRERPHPGQIEGIPVRRVPGDWVQRLREK